MAAIDDLQASIATLAGVVADFLANQPPSLDPEIEAATAAVAAIAARFAPATEPVPAPVEPQPAAN